MSIEVQGLTKKYDRQIAVDRIQFSIGSGEVVGFLGPNGAGKSTTMKMLTCFIPPTEGTAKVCGFDISTHPIEVRKNIGYLPEHNPLYLDMYVKEYLEFAAGMGGVKKRTSRVKDVIGLTGLTPETHKKIAQLSKGFRQRVGLAQAIIHQPKVLILDEPTSGLDPNQVMGIRQLIKDLGKDSLVMLSTHIMQEVEAICNRVIIINKGQLVADDSIDTLRNKNKEMKAVRIQFAEDVPQEMIMKIPSIEKAQSLGNFTWKLESSLPQFRSEVSKFALSHNYEVRELVEEKNSLEEIFRSLTGNVDHI